MKIPALTVFWVMMILAFTDDWLYARHSKIHRVIHDYGWILLAVAAVSSLLVVVEAACS